MIEGWDTTVTYVLTPPQVHWSFSQPIADMVKNGGLEALGLLFYLAN